jgi:hypothetical protein
MLGELVGQHLAAARYGAQSDAVRHRRFGEESPQRRRREMRRRDGLLDHGADEVGGVLVTLGLRDDKACADGQRPEDLRH